MNTEMLMQYITYALGGIGILAFLVSVVVQVIKEMPDKWKAWYTNHVAANKANLCAKVIARTLTSTILWVPRYAAVFW